MCTKTFYLALILFILTIISSCSQSPTVEFSKDFDNTPIKSIVIFPLLIIHENVDVAKNAYAPSWLKPFNDCTKMDSDDCTLAQKDIVDWIHEKFPSYRIIDPSTVNFEMEGLEIPSEVEAISYVANHYSADAVFVFKIDEFSHTKVKQNEEYVGGFVYAKKEKDNITGMLNFSLFDGKGPNIWKLSAEHTIEDRCPMPVQDYIKDFFGAYKNQLEELVNRLKSQ